MDVVDDTDSLNDDTGDDGIAEEDEEVQRTSSRANPDQVIVNWSFLDALNLLCNPTYHLYDAFLEVCKIYSIAIAIPISTCTAERSFSALKRIKTRLRSTMAQERLEDLLMMSVEHKILSSVSCDSIIDQFARSSSELSKALLYMTLSHQSYTCMDPLGHHAVTCNWGGFHVVMRHNALRDIFFPILS